MTDKCRVVSWMGAWNRNSIRKSSKNMDLSGQCCTQIDSYIVTNVPC